MDWSEMQGTWTEWKGMVKEKWGRLTDDDLKVIDGKKDVLVGTLQKHYGLEKKAAEREIELFMKANPVAGEDKTGNKKDKSSCGC